MKRGKIEAVRQYLQRKDININDLIEDTTITWRANYASPVLIALVWRCKSDDKIKCEIAQMLIHARANVNVTATDGCDALIRCMLSPDLLKILLAANPPPTLDSLNRSLNFKATSDARECQMLLDARANVNSTDSQFGDTPLMQAVANGQQTVVSVLLAARADVHIKNKTGHTALTLQAIRRCEDDATKCRDLIRMHLAAKIDLQSQSKGNTPFSFDLPHSTPTSTTTSNTPFSLICSR